MGIINCLLCSRKKIGRSSCLEYGRSFLCARYPPLLCVSALLFILSLRNCYNKKSRLPLPPGPRKLPILGNLLDFPPSFEWEAYQKWGKEYKSDILHLNVFGTSVIVLNSLDVISDLLDKRSSIHSGRPKFTLINKYMGFAWLLPFLSYGTAWKERRRVFQRYFQSKTLDNTTWQQQEVVYTRRLLLQLLETPEKYTEHIRHFIGGTLHSITYGTATKQFNDPHINFAEDVMNALSETATPISGVIDIFPWSLPVLSSIFPGPPFNKSRAEWKELVYRFRDEPVLKIQKLMAEGSVNGAFVPKSLENIDPSKNKAQEQDLIKDVAGVVFIGGLSTTKAVLHSFILAMMCFPEAQMKAQEELDRVVGRERLPERRDEPFLPYLSAVLKEVQRWNPPGPIGIPHFLEQDDEYNGYLIPGQSLIIGNAWAILNDENEYPNPRSFIPERFLKDGQLDPSVRDPADVGFGFGRRICPGVHVALSAIWISAASILSTFTISKALNENGEIVEPTMQYSSGVTHQPEPFKCTIKPRHHTAGNIIRAYVSSE